MRRVMFDSTTSTGPEELASSLGPSASTITLAVSPSSESGPTALPNLSGDAPSSFSLPEIYQVTIRDFQRSSQTSVVEYSSATVKDNLVSQESSSGSQLVPCSDNDQFPALILESLRNSLITSISTDPDTSIALTSGQASLLSSLFSLARSDSQSPKLTETDPNNQVVASQDGPSWPSVLWHEDEDSVANDDDDDPEGIRAIICRSPTPDPNTQAMHCHLCSKPVSKPDMFREFDAFSSSLSRCPLGELHSVRAPESCRDDQRRRVMQFASSPGPNKECLIANVIGRLSKSQSLVTGRCRLWMLRTQAHQHIEDFHSEGPAIERARDMQNAHRVLDSMMEHFAATDVLISVATARPMFFKYDVKCTPQTYAQLLKGDYGLRWLHGAPDHFIVLLAWINALYEEYGTNADPMYIGEIESQVRSTKIEPNFTPDAVLLILRLAVQECWRQAVCVYLYMVLCGAQADDPRVTRAVRSFVYIVDGVSPGRNPDSFLFIPIMMVGCFAHREQDRSVLRRRMMGLQECSNPGAASYECLEVLEDVWERTRAEDRPAVWSDLRLSYRKITGV
ncbi:hypothetical protein RHS01_07981 [Rhizoctonia solani]|uniref:Fungal-specific transcription factor domain-containing protein n=1 Tax=Rhizoctonia solani TaxID=456999 RepID=A0A8H7I6I3_9AGAM|nr:hypothetical protein RHS01_07981 [Rhizoctonia solani]